MYVPCKAVRLSFINNAIPGRVNARVLDLVQARDSQSLPICTSKIILYKTAIITEKMAFLEQQCFVAGGSSQKCIALAAHCSIIRR